MAQLVKVSKTKPDQMSTIAVTYKKEGKSWFLQLSSDFHMSLPKMNESMNEWMNEWEKKNLKNLKWKPKFYLKTLDLNISNKSHFILTVNNITTEAKHFTDSELPVFCLWSNLNPSSYWYAETGNNIVNVPNLKRILVSKLQYMSIYWLASSCQKRPRISMWLFPPT